MCTLMSEVNKQVQRIFFCFVFLSRLLHFTSLFLIHEIIVSLSDCKKTSLIHPHSKRWHLNNYQLGKNIKERRNIRCPSGYLLI